MMTRGTMFSLGVVVTMCLSASPADARTRRSSKPKTTKTAPVRPPTPTESAKAVSETSPAPVTSAGDATPEAKREEDSLGASAMAGGDRPWAAGVSPEDQATAARLFREGNALLKESVFVKAAEKYRLALSHWDHPGIHYNLVLALLNLDQPLEVDEHLTAAMKYGAAPIDEDKLDQARRYKALIAGQLATITVTCNEPGAQVRMDGRDLFIAPGNYTATVRAGPHTVLASKEGFLTNEVSRTLEPQTNSTFDMTLVSTSDLTRYRRKWSAWVPWSVVGAGAAAALLGGGFQYSSANSYNSFDASIRDCGGCVPTDDIRSHRRSGTLYRKAAIGSYAVGGIALIAGAILVYVNRLQPYQVNAQGEEEVVLSSADLVSNPFALQF